MAETPSSIEFTVGVRGPSGEWVEIGTVDVPVSVVTRREGAFIDLARSRRIDNTPCPICGGDRLRTDFTGSGRCHAAMKELRTPPLLDVPESAVFDPPAKRCVDCGRLLRPAVDSVVGTEHGLAHARCSGPFAPGGITTNKRSPERGLIPHDRP